MFNARPSPRSRLRPALLAAALLLCAHAALANVLLALAPVRVQGSPVAVEDGAGLVASPIAGVAAPSWSLVPGDTLSRSTAPAPRRVDLYQKTAGKLKLVAVIKVRYFADRHGDWVPYFRMSEQLYFVPTGNGWKPLALVGGVPSMVSATSQALPNAEGYYPSLTFSSTTGPITIDAWAVYRITSSLSAPYP
ncbi:MAG: hypothetical protein ACYCQK_10730 [Acidiferrobacteraceae bacterium]